MTINILAFYAVDLRNTLQCQHNYFYVKMKLYNHKNKIFDIKNLKIRLVNIQLENALSTYYIAVYLV